MAYSLFITELISAFILAACLLYRYGDCYRNHIIVTLAVLTAWYFSFLIVFILPLDVSSTVYRQCLQERGGGTNNHSGVASTSSTPSIVVTTPEPPCQPPGSLVEESVFPNLWRVVYWTSQCLTWLIMPMMQSYSKAGDFTIKGKLKSALIDNAIYYGSYLFICGILLVYIALKPEVSLDGPKVKAIASSASNTWGLFLLILLLGHALVEVPRSLWQRSVLPYTLTRAYFKAAKLSSDKCEAEESVDDILEAIQSLHLSVGPASVLRRPVDDILRRIPAELRDRMERRALPTAPSVTPSLKALVRLHKQVIKALQTLQRTQTQWGLLLEEVLYLEDVAVNMRSREHRFKTSFSRGQLSWTRVLYTPAIEWYWECVMKRYVLRLLAVCAAALSMTVVWSEVTFFNKSPVLSIFANIVNLAKVNYDYLTIEAFSTIIIAYMCFCAFSTVLKIRVLNLYYLAPHHQTNEYSLIFSGMMVCRLTPPLCLNFLGLIHMDSHVIKEHIMETHYTQIMGHMDVLGIISDGFNIYFPMLVLVLCLSTYFSVGSRLLSLCGFQQFVGDVELTTDLVEEGKEIIKREKRKRQRLEESALRRKEFQGKLIGSGRHDAEARAGLLASASDAVPYTDSPDPAVGAGSVSSAALTLDEEIDRRFGASTLYQGDTLRRQHQSTTAHTIMPPRGLFDDV